MLGKFLQTISLRNLVKWGQKEDGTTAIEFSLLAIPFVFLITGIIELSIMFASATMLEGATGAAARMIRTGQIQQASADPQAQEAMFRQAVCDFAAVLVNCGNIQIQVADIDGFGDFGDFGTAVDGNGDLANQGFNAGGVNDVIMVRVAYRYNLMTPMIGQLLGEGGTGSRLFVSTIVQQTEPYEI